MSASPIYTYPVPKLAAGTPVIEATQGTITINNVYKEYEKLFGLSGTGGTYGGYLNAALKSLKGILNGGEPKKAGNVIDIEDLASTFEALKKDSFYKEAQSFKDPNKDIRRIDEFCREGFLAYRYYLKTIVSILDRIYGCLVGGREALEELKDEIDSDAAHPLITQLEINEKLMYEEFQKLCTYYKYNADTKQWDQVVLLNEDTFGKADVLWFNRQFSSKKEDTPQSLTDVRNIIVKVTDSSASGGESPTKLNVFNALTLFDRLRYISWYYRRIINCGDSDYSVFPNDVDTGYPCLPNEESSKSTEDTKSLGAMELFYIGYLIDRDGPINAVASFFEVKVAALRNNLELMSKKITALNAYLEITNWGMDKLNQSQTNKTKKSDKVVIPDDTVLVFTYLCCQKMYNLFEDDGGEKFFVIQSLYKQGETIKHYAVPVDRTEGFGNGNRVYLDRKENKEILYTLEVLHGHWYKETAAGVFKFTGTCDDLTHEDLKDEHVDGKYFGNRYNWFAEEETDKEGNFLGGCYLGGNKEGFKRFKKKFTLPTELDVHAILPESVKYYNNATDEKFISGLEENDYSSMIESWTNAFSNKTQYINTAIDTINTDVSVDRSKIDTFDSLTSTFRSRAQDTYLNIISNVRG